MAKNPRLKVFRHSIGFHDAYVAASSQKDALAAWGAQTDLFASGMAERVEDPDLMREPLANPARSYADRVAPRIEDAALVTFERGGKISVIPRTTKATAP